MAVVAVAGGGELPRDSSMPNPGEVEKRQGKCPALGAKVRRNPGQHTWDLQIRYVLPRMISKAQLRLCKHKNKIHFTRCKNLKDRPQGIRIFVGRCR